MGGGLHPAVAATRVAVRRALAGLPGGDVVVGVSGGADSLALAAAVAFEAPGRAHAVVVDHGLQAGSAGQARTTTTQLAPLALASVRVERVEVGTAGGPEAAARDARYAALEAPGLPVLLGHTLDDQAETVLLALGRGSGPAALAGMASDARRVRPFLGLRREVTRAACAAQDLRPWDDPHNDDARFTRVRVRREVLPLLEQVLGGGVAEALARTATQVRADASYLDALAGAAVTDDAAALAALPDALRGRVLKRLAEGAGAGPLTATHVAALDALVVAWRGQGRVDLPGGFGARRVSGRLEFVRTRPGSGT